MDIHRLAFLAARLQASDLPFLGGHLTFQGFFISTNMSSLCVPVYTPSHAGKDFAGYHQTHYYDDPPTYTPFIPDLSIHSPPSTPTSLPGFQDLTLAPLIPPPPYTPAHSLSTYTSSQPFINPWINGHQPRSDFFFDLASTAFAPLRLFDGGFSAPLHPDDLREPATLPPLTRLRIVCDLIPQWPIDLEFHADALAGYGSNPFNPPPISLVDVLIAVHRAMHTRITHAEWAMLSIDDQKAISRTFYRRCKAVLAAYEMERANGVMRVDFLRGKTRMLGVERAAPVDGLEVIKLVLADWPLGSLLNIPVTKVSPTVSPTEESLSGQSGIPSISLARSEAIVVERDHKHSQTRPSRMINFICWPDSGKFVFQST